MQTDPGLETLGPEPAKTLLYTCIAGVGIRRVTSEAEAKLVGKVGEGYPESKQRTQRRPSI